LGIVCPIPVRSRPDAGLPKAVAVIGEIIRALGSIAGNFPEDEDEDDV
jgi:hypothetical protein